MGKTKLELFKKKFSNEYMKDLDANWADKATCKYISSKLSKCCRIDKICGENIIKFIVEYRSICEE